MSTSGSFTPPATPECAYAPQMTRAAALALRAGGLLNPNCVVVITDGPVIGTAGNTSPTLIELQPVSTTDLGRAALVHTTFDNVAFIGNYDIDAGANGSLNGLTDHWNNHVSDEDSGAPTVHNQFPWHLAGNNMRDNEINDCVLTGWGALTGAVVITDNELQETTVNLTGKTAGTFQQNVINGGSVTALTANSTISANQLNQATVSHVGTTAGVFSFQNNVMLTGSVSVDAASTAQLTMNNNVFGGATGGYRVALTGKTGTPVVISGNRLFSQGGGAQELLATGGGTVTASSNEIISGGLTFNGPASASVTGSSLSGFTATSGPGVLTISALQSGSTTVTHGGSGVLTLSASTLTSSTITMAGPSTRGLTVDQTTSRTSAVTQNGTGNTNTDTITDGTILHRGTVVLGSSSAGAPNAAYRGFVLDSGGVLNMASFTDPTPVANSHINNGATANLSGAGTLVRTRVDSQAVLNNAFPATSCIVEGQFTITATAANTGKLANAAYSDWV